MGKLVILFYDRLRPRSPGGQSTHIHELLSGLSKIGHDVVALNADCVKDHGDGETNMKPTAWTIKSSVSQSRILKPVAGEIAGVRSFLYEMYIFISAFILIARRRRRFDIIYRRHDLFNSEYLLAKLFRIPSVKEVNGIIADETKITRRGHRISLWVIDRIERLNMPKADKIIVVTSRLKEVLQKHYGVPEDKIVVIPNGANTDLFKPMDATKAREELGLSLSDSYVCFVGSLWQAQGVEYLIKSAPLVLEKYPNTQFLIVGDGQMRMELIELTKEIGVSDKVIFTGIVPYQKVPSYINASDICVSPEARNFRSERAGGSSLKLYEYMACGRPVVTGNVEGNRDDVAESESGLVVDSTSADEMATAVIKLLGNEQLRNEMGKRGRKAAVERYSWREIAEQVAVVCQGIVKGKGAYDKS